MTVKMEGYSSKQKQNKLFEEAYQAQTTLLRVIGKLAITNGLYLYGSKGGSGDDRHDSSGDNDSGSDLSGTTKSRSRSDYVEGNARVSATS